MTEDRKKPTARKKPGPKPAAKIDKAPGNMRMWVGAGIGAGIGSAAIAAALLYANRAKHDGPMPKGPKDDAED